MRILLVTDHYPPFIGGAHRWAELTAHGLARRGHQVAVVAEWGAGMPMTERHDDVVVHRVRQVRTAVTRLISDPKQRHSPPFPDPVTVFDADRIVREFAPDVAFAHGWLSTSVAPALTRAGTPMLLSCHDYGPVCPTRVMYNAGETCSGPAPAKCLRCATDWYGTRLRGVLSVAGVAAARPVLGRALGGVQCVSEFVDRTVWDNLFGDDPPASLRRFVIPSFLDTDPPSGAADEAEVKRFVGLLPDVPFILFVGALRRIKGVHVLLEAYQQLRDPPPLVLMGTRHEDSPTTVPAGCLMLEDVPHPAVMIAWARALVGVVPSVWPEPNATVSFECASQGTPVIATEPSGMVDAFGDGSGIIVPQRDARALAEALRSVIDDPELRKRLGRAGREKAQRFQAETVLAEYESALAQLVADRAA